MIRDDLKTLFEFELEKAREDVRDKENLLFLLNTRSVGCQCDPRDWFDGVVPEICSDFVPMNDLDSDVCETCEHSKVCHDKREEEQ